MPEVSVNGRPDFGRKKDGMDEEAATKKLPPPYVGFPRFLSAIEALEKGIPNRIDRSIWADLSPNQQYDMFRAFRFLGLIAEDGEPLNLEELVTDQGARKQNLRSILARSYPQLVSLTNEQASTKQLEDAVESMGVKGATRRKAITFFLNAAEYAGLPLSPHWPKGKKRRRGVAVAKRPKTSRVSGKGVGTTQREPVHRESGMRAGVTLKSGGEVTLSASVDLFAMSKQDRDWLLAIVDMIRDYRGESPDEGGS